MSEPRTKSKKESICEFWFESIKSPVTAALLIVALNMGVTAFFVGQSEDRTISRILNPVYYESERLHDRLDEIERRIEQDSGPVELVRTPAPWNTGES